MTPERTATDTAALAMELYEHLKTCAICVMPMDPKTWHGVVLCPVIKAWFDLHFPR